MLQLNVKNETSRLRAVVLGSAVDNGPTPTAEEAYDPKSLEHILAGTYPVEKDMVNEMEAFNKVFQKYDVKVFRPERIENYNQIWTTQSNNSSESMPLGGGDIGANVWVEKGDLYFYRVDSDLRGKLGGIRTDLCPLYLLTGEYDFSCSPEDTIRTAQSIPGAKVTVMKEVGHFPMSENPKQFKKYLLPVLKEIAG
jgi:pimeloyl-ACP methyl ester carboxylesterase